jgi:membrane protease YdiL (CAAX protease family)
MEWQGEWTPKRLIAVVLLIAATWNVVGNLFLPSAAYIPANLAIAALLIVIARRSGLDWPDLGLARVDLGRGIVIGLAAFLVIGVVIGLGLVLPPLEEIFQDDSVGDASDFDRWFVPLVRIPLGTAVYEEVVFRSVLLGIFLVALRRTWHAVAVTSVLFGLWHIVPAVESAGDGALAVVGAVVGTVFITALGGVLFGVLRTWSRSVVAPILAHTATNSLAFLAALVAIEVLD